jgi:hypothetical protein
LTEGAGSAKAPVEDGARVWFAARGAAPPAPPAAAAGRGGPRIELRRRGIRLRLCRRGALLRIDVGQRRLYLEPPLAGSDRHRLWIVHADGVPGEPARQEVFATPDGAARRILAELADANTPVTVR